VAPFDPQSRIASLERELAWAQLKIQSLTEELRQYRVKLLGPRSETLNDLQLELLTDQEPGTTLDEVGAETQRPPLAEAARRERRPHPGRQRLSENLPRVEEIVCCAEQACRHCGAETAVIGYDEPARYFVRVIKREKRACRGCQAGTVMMPPLAPRIVEKGWQVTAWWWKRWSPSMRIICRCTGRLGSWRGTREWRLAGPR